jgi:predicted small secreted protein
MRSKIWYLLISVLVISMLVTACGNAATATPAAQRWLNRE